jgi:hypothetical protein
VGVLTAEIDRRGSLGFVAVEKAEWHVTSTGSVKALSHLTITSCPENKHEVELFLPYANGQVESIVAGGESIPYKETGAGRVKVEFPVPWRSLLLQEIQVDWVFPFDALKQEPEGYYRAQLRGLIPVHSYTLNVVLDPECGFEADGDPSVRRLTPFTGEMHPPVRKIGSCGIMIHKSKPSPLNQEEE